MSSNRSYSITQIHLENAHNSVIFVRHSKSHISDRGPLALKAFITLLYSFMSQIMTMAPARSGQVVIGSHESKVYIVIIISNFLLNRIFFNTEK